MNQSSLDVCHVTKKTKMEAVNVEAVNISQVYTNLGKIRKCRFSLTIPGNANCIFLKKEMTDIQI